MTHRREASASMTLLHSFTLWTLLVIYTSSASATSLPGFGLKLYDPLCAESCVRSFSSLKLSCSIVSQGVHKRATHSPVFTPPKCKANNEAFLTSVASCFNTKCSEEKMSKLEAFWEESVTGTNKVPAKWTYSEALAEVQEHPAKYQLKPTDFSLNETSIAEPTTYLKQWNQLGGYRNEMEIESRYSITLVVIALGLPIVITWLGYMPYIPTIYDKLKPFMLYPSTIGTYSVRPLPFKLGNVPNIGQAAFIIIFVSLTVVFASIDYDVRQPNARFESTKREQLAYLVYRTGSFAYALLPVIVLFPSRNNILLSLSNWSRSTFILLHRWVGRIFTLLAVLHAIFALAGSKTRTSADWRSWGDSTVILSVITTVGSGLYFRKENYELFLLMHVILAVFIVVGCWYHLIKRYEVIGLDFPHHSYGQEIWLYLTCAIWFFERLVRVVRVVRLGILRSKVKDIGSGYVRIDIPHVRWGLDPGKHVFVYFPTLAPLRPWENHPFSVIPTVALRCHGSASSPTTPVSPGGSSGLEDMEKSVTQIGSKPVLPSAENSAGVTLFIKKSAGITKHLRSYDRLFTFLEGPYPGNDTRQILRCDRLLLIAGGVGITSVFALAHNHWNVKLAWSVKEDARCLVNELEPAMDAISTAQVDIRVGSRFNVTALIDEESSRGWERVGIVVSGPGSLCDESRAVVAGPCRPVSSIEASYSTTLVVSSSTEAQSTETLETSLTVPTTDVTTSTTTEEATTVTTDGLTTTESTTAATTTADSSTTTTIAYTVPTSFKLLADGSDADGLAVKLNGNPGRSLVFGELPDYDEVVFSFQEETGYVQYDSKDLCVYYGDSDPAAQVITCTTVLSGRQFPLSCEKPDSNQLKCTTPGKTCFTARSDPTAGCSPTDEDWTQFYVRPYISGSFLLYLGNGNAMADELDDMDLKAVDLRLKEAKDT
ncbi:hypothetical protein ACHAPM_002923 [Fusarium culmorum]|uniref:Ferric reductase transmembrane component 3 n=1 Tax=Fusarium culmorum TaxID=5516 RepID=A0A2T4GV68_FUSCU|nr:Ferric reductase transmembrane component 3 [Fusarium culmorum]